MSGISVEYETKTILELRNLQEQGHLNLEPGFQRESVWTEKDRRRLIESILEGYPLPSIFLYRREESGHLVYDVLDGKQRLETIFMFSKVRPFKRQGFWVDFQFPEDDGVYSYEWRGLNDWGLAPAFLKYKVQVAEVSGDLSDIVELFVRINSTGKPLTTSERRHARYYNSRFLKEAERLAKRHRWFFKNNRILTDGQIDRMKDVELVSELLASIVYGGPINKKQAVDKAVGNESINGHTLNKAAKELSATLATIKQMFPDLRSTRFSHVSEFYTLFLVIWEMRHQKLVLNDTRRNAMAMQMLKEFSDGVDAVREAQRTARGAKPHQRIFVDYLMLVQQSTDALPPRRRRAEIVRNLLAGIFEKKSDRRVFSPEQRRLLWNSEEKKKCSICDEPLGWTNFQVDHVKPYSRGGRTSLKNAALVCGPCNASKGAGRSRAARVGATV